jgi:hypothetical protein
MEYFYVVIIAFGIAFFIFNWIIDRRLYKILNLRENWIEISYKERLTTPYTSMPNLNHILYHFWIPLRKFDQEFKKKISILKFANSITQKI